MGEAQARGASAGERTREIEEIGRRAEQLALGTAPMLFAEAYMIYLGAGHSPPLHGARILEAIGTTSCDLIDDTIVQALKASLFKSDAKPSYVNRHLYTPILAVLRLTMRERAPKLIRPKGYKVAPPISIPDETWFRAISPHLAPRTAALVALLTIHGRRLGDALGRTGHDFDPVARTLMIAKTKSGKPLLVHLHPKVSALIDAARPDDPDAWLFGTGPASGSDVRRSIAKACVKAKVPCFSPHKLGRHVFATRLLRKGFSMEHVREAGDWASIDMPSRHYAHLAASDITEAVHAAADDCGLFKMDPVRDSGAEMGLPHPGERSKDDGNA